MQVCNLKNPELEKYLNHLFTVERRTTAQILECLSEISRRRLYLDLGYTSLFAYLNVHFAHPPATAQRWIDTVRMMASNPEIKENIQSGELNLTQVSILAQNLREKKKEDPQAKFQENVLIESIKNQTVAQTQVILAKSLNLEIKIQEKKKLQQDESVRMELTFSKEQMLVLERAQELLSHQHPHLSMAELILKLASEFIKQKDPRRPSSRPKAASLMEVISAEKEALVKDEAHRAGRNQTSKAIPRPIHRAVHQRDQCCQWPVRVSNGEKAHGQKCGSQFQLQVDHIKPLWAQGEAELDNLQLLCAVHNREKYRLEANIVRRAP